MAISNKPFVWSLFAGGGLAAALLAPVMIVLTGLAVPLGLMGEEALAFDRMSAFVGNPIVKSILFAVLCLLLWHAAHRLRMTAHDLGIGGGRAAAVLFYSLATLGSIGAGVVLLSI